MNNIYNTWKSSPYNDANLAKKTFSYRLPVHVAARLAAIEEMFPDLSRSQVIIEILKAGLLQFEASLPAPTQELLRNHDPAMWQKADLEDPSTKILVGPKVEYCNIANQHYQKYEIERGNKDPKPPFKAV